MKNSDDYTTVLNSNFYKKSRIKEDYKLVILGSATKKYGSIAMQLIQRWPENSKNNP